MDNSITAVSVDVTRLQEENTYLKEQLAKAKDSINRLSNQLIKAGILPDDNILYNESYDALIGLDTGSEIDENHSSQRDDDESRHHTRRSSLTASPVPSHYSTGSVPPGFRRPDISQYGTDNTTDQSVTNEHTYTNDMNNTTSNRGELRLKSSSPTGISGRSSPLLYSSASSIVGSAYCGIHCNDSEPNNSNLFSSSVSVTAGTHSNAGDTTDYAYPVSSSSSSSLTTTDDRSTPLRHPHPNQRPRQHNGSTGDNSSTTGSTVSSVSSKKSNDGNGSHNAPRPNISSLPTTLPNTSNPLTSTEVLLTSEYKNNFPENYYTVTNNNDSKNNHNDYINVSSNSSVIGFPSASLSAVSSKCSSVIAPNPSPPSPLLYKQRTENNSILDRFPSFSAGLTNTNTLSNSLTGIDNGATFSQLRTTSNNLSMMGGDLTAFNLSGSSSLFNTVVSGHNGSNNGNSSYVSTNTVNGSRSSSSNGSGTPVNTTQGLNTSITTANDTTNLYSNTNGSSNNINTRNNILAQFAYPITNSSSNHQGKNNSYVDMTILATELQNLSKALASQKTNRSNSSEDMSRTSPNSTNTGNNSSNNNRSFQASSGPFTNNNSNSTMFSATDDSLVNNARPTTSNEMNNGTLAQYISPKFQHSITGQSYTNTNSNGNVATGMNASNGYSANFTGNNNTSPPSLLSSISSPFVNTNNSNATNLSFKNNLGNNNNYGKMTMMNSTINTIHTPMNYPDHSNLNGYGTNNVPSSFTNGSSAFSNTNTPPLPPGSSFSMAQDNMSNNNYMNSMMISNNTNSNTGNNLFYNSQQRSPHPPLPGPSNYASSPYNQDSMQQGYGIGLGMNNNSNSNNYSNVPIPPNDSSTISPPLPSLIDNGTGIRPLLHPEDREKDMNSMRCRYCGEFGHMMRYCPRVVCFTCHSTGHMASVCPFQNHS